MQPEPLGTGSESWQLWAPCLHTDRGSRAARELSTSSKMEQPMQSPFPSPPQGETPFGLYEKCRVIVNHHSFLAKKQFFLPSLCFSLLLWLQETHRSLFDTKIFIVQNKRKGEGGGFSFCSVCSNKRDVFLLIYGNRYTVFFWILGLFSLVSQG